MAGIVVTGLVMLVGVEFLLYSRYVGAKAHIHPFIMLIGIIGGIIMFGIFRFIIGPLIPVYSIKVLELAMSPNGTRRYPVRGQIQKRTVS